MDDDLVAAFSANLLSKSYVDQGAQSLRAHDKVFAQVARESTDARQRIERRGD